MQSGIQRNPKSVSGHKGLARKLIAAFLVLLLPILWKSLPAPDITAGAIRELVKIYGNWFLEYVKLTSEHFCEV